MSAGPGYDAWKARNIPPSEPGIDWSKRGDGPIMPWMDDAARPDWVPPQILGRPNGVMPGRRPENLPPGMQLPGGALGEPGVNPNPPIMPLGPQFFNPKPPQEEALPRWNGGIRPDHPPMGVPENWPELEIDRGGQLIPDDGTMVPKMVSPKMVSPKMVQSVQDWFRDRKMDARGMQATLSNRLANALPGMGGGHYSPDYMPSWRDWISYFPNSPFTPGGFRKGEISPYDPYDDFMWQGSRFQ